MLSVVLVDLILRSIPEILLFREGTTSESEIGTSVKKQGQTGHTSDSKLSSPIK